MRVHGARERVRGGGLEQLALGADRDELPRPHREGAGQQACDTGEQHDVRRDSRRTDAEDEGEVGDQAVVHPEHGRAEPARHLCSPARGERAHDLGVDALVRDHPRGRVPLGGVLRAGLRALHQGEHEHRAEPPGEPTEHAGAQRKPGRLGPSGSEEVEPVLLVALLRVGEGEQDLGLLPLPSTGQVTIDRGLGSLVGEVAAPAAHVGRGGGGPQVLRRGVGGGIGQGR